MRGLPVALVALAWGTAAAEAGPRRVPDLVPVVEEGVSLSRVPRRPGSVPAVDLGKVLIGAEAPARVDVYALAEDGRDHVPVASIDRFVTYVPVLR
jgi:hypothetical protein